MIHEFAMPHLAYIDPGSGTLALQMLIAAVAGAVVMFKSRIASIFGRLKGKNGRSE
ncbi:MAG TPA: hypothetical protein VG820_05215 [Fimbriimonadaceae bacterium]|nr:hypothetical protein [Fimbriimonadaceae bacterium]